MAENTYTTQALRRDVSALEAIRIEQDLTYDAFAEATGLSRRNLIRLIVERELRVQKRTHYKIKQYIRKIRGESAA